MITKIGTGFNNKQLNEKRQVQPSFKSLILSEKAASQLMDRKSSLGLTLDKFRVKNKFINFVSDAIAFAKNVIVNHERDTSTAFDTRIEEIVNEPFLQHKVIRGLGKTSPQEPVPDNTLKITLRSNDTESTVDIPYSLKDTDFKFINDNEQLIEKNFFLPEFAQKIVNAYSDLASTPNAAAINAKINRLKE